MSSTPPPAQAAGSIYDLGYRRYGGPRLGRRHAVGSLVRHSLRSAYGIGRGGRAKVIPFVLLGLAVLPAVVALGVLGLANQAGFGDELAEASPIRYDTYFGFIGMIVTLFVAAQAPELVGRDQRHGVLSLYFSRALRRSDYALARAGGLVAALLVVLLVPQALILLGRILSSRDLAGGLAENVGQVPAIVAEALLIAGLVGGLALAVAAFTPRRAYATVAIIALVIVPPIVAAVAHEAAGPEIGRWAVLASVGDVLDGTNAFFFDSSPQSELVLMADLPGPVYLAVAVVGIAAALGVLVRRYQTLTA